MRTVIREIIETVLLALVVYLALQVSVQPYRVEGSSMVPTLAEGEYLTGEQDGLLAGTVARRKR